MREEALGLEEWRYLSGAPLLHCREMRLHFDRTSTSRDSQSKWLKECANSRRKRRGERHRPKRAGSLEYDERRKYLGEEKGASFLG